MNKDLTKQTTNSPERIQQRPALNPPVDVYENRDEILVVADVPGANNDAVNVRVEKDQLTLHVAREGGWKGEPLLGRTRVADWTRTFVVPRGIDSDKIAAELKDGVLTIHLPKSEAVKPRQIQVRVG